MRRTKMWSNIVVWFCVILVIEIYAKEGKMREDVKQSKKSLLERHAIIKQRRDVVCTVNQFSCPERCIPLYYVCDTISDCTNGYDEQNCTACSGVNQFKCANGQCIPIAYHCDSDNDCGDGSDELNCAPRTCSPTRFTCSNGNCVNSLYICDGYNDCGDNSDEQDCQGRTCSGIQFTCGNLKCIPHAYQCDGDNDCGDHSDETGCTCDTNHFQCTTGGCISTSYKCDGENDCGDMSDEANCPEIHPGACADLLTFEDCIRMNTATYPICDSYADAHRFCRKYCSLCNT